MSEEVVEEVEEHPSQKIKNKYPRLYKRCGIGVGEGWLPLIEELSEKLEAIYQALPDEEKTKAQEEGSYGAGQIKEKFGTLRFYMDGETDEMSAAIAEAEEASRVTCEYCGKPGKMDHYVSWAKTLCFKCSKARLNEKAESNARYQTMRVVEVLLPYIEEENWAIILTKLGDRRLKSDLVKELRRKFDPVEIAREKARRAAQGKRLEKMRQERAQRRGHPKK